MGEDAMMVGRTASAHLVDSQAVAPCEAQEHRVVEGPRRSETVASLKRRLKNRLWLGAAKLTSVASAAPCNGSSGLLERVRALNTPSTGTPQRHTPMDSGLFRLGAHLEGMTLPRGSPVSYGPV